jgi:hypothetical protein
VVTFEDAFIRLTGENLSEEIDKGGL